MHQTIKPVAGALVLSLILVACGGGGGDEAASSTAAPAASTSSAAASSQASSTASSAAAAGNSSSAAAAGNNSSAAASPTTTVWTPVRASFVPTYAGSACGTDSKGATTANNHAFAATTSAFTVDGLTFYSSSAGSLRLYDQANADCSGTASGAFAINYNGSSFATADAGTTWAAGGTIDLTTVSRYIQVPYTKAATTAPELSVTFTNASSSNQANNQVVITDKAGKVLSVINAAVSAETVISAKDTATLGGDGSFYILFTRAGSTSGGIRVWKTELKK